jgi:tRNA-dihydrouridine synthase B
MTSSRTDIRALLAANNVVLGPMAGVTEAPFRGICKRLGAGLTYTEMVSAKALHYNPNSRIARHLLTFDPAETPCAVQLYGAEPDIMAAQAAGIVDRYGDGVACIDINMGCPVGKVISRGEGSALMRTPELAAHLVSEVAAAVAPLQVTAKIRAGWDDSSRNAVEFACVLEDAGVAAIAVHGRTRAQFYRGAADWDLIAAVKAAVSVPVIGSGDVFSAPDAEAMIARTGVDAVMVARGAQGDPWIFREARCLIDTGVLLDPPTGAERIAMAREHTAALVAFAGERVYTRMRKHVGWYLTGLRGASYARERVNAATSSAEIDALLAEYAAWLQERGAL